MTEKRRDFTELSDAELMELTGGQSFMSLDDAEQSGSPSTLLKYGITPAYGIEPVPLYGIVVKYGISPNSD